MEKNMKKEVTFLSKYCCFSPKTGMLVCFILEIILDIVAARMLTTLYSPIYNNTNRYYKAIAIVDIGRYAIVIIIIKQIIGIFANFVPIYILQKKFVNRKVMADMISIKMKSLLISMLLVWICVSGGFHVSAEVGLIIFIIGHLYLELIITG
ncbi:uncharacterized protein LOC130673042 isoform X2 [Microplitis mediator]|uniref:uncharacterized protein LOC130673042 isoform X2 n=1 Tax=Microplitis mediator TaxID=375433 RepID=UPI0025546607|nr:uncharacterized protein LOC130673042 isoform X2 [Microplitis mediator]